jgi:hypothetical protein
MSTRWIAGRNFNALARGLTTSPHADTFYSIANIYHELPLRPAKFNQSGQNDVLLDAQIAGASPFVVRAGELLRLISVTGSPTLFNVRSQNYLQLDGTWADSSAVLTTAMTFFVEDYDVLQREWAALAFAGGTLVVVPVLDSLTIHGHAELWQLADAIQWHSGASANPTGLVVAAAPVAFTQLLSAATPTLNRFHRVSLFGDLPIVGTAVLGAMTTIARCTGIGRVVSRTWKQSRLSMSAGLVDSYPWVKQESRAWEGRLQAPNGQIQNVLERLHRASEGGAQAMVFIPEENVVMMGRIGQSFETETLGPTTERAPFTFEESPLPLAE